MFVTRGNAYDDFVTMRNFSGSATEKFLMLVDGREVLQPMGGTITWGTEEVPLASWIVQKLFGVRVLPFGGLMQ